MFFRLALERDYTRAQVEGLRVMLTGEAGDPLYIAGQEWLADFVTEGRFRDALRGLHIQIQNKGLRYPFVAGHLHPIVRHFLQQVAPWVLKLRRRRFAQPVWLSRAAKKILNKGKSWVDPALERHGTLLGLRLAYHCSRENINANRYSLELRYPYRDRRLIEYVISIPAYMLHYGGLYKHILRIAMRNILPEAIRSRKKATFLNSLLIRGFERERQIVQDNLYGTNDLAWSRFVKKKWLLKRLNAPFSMLNLTVAWLCISYESWRRNFYLAN
jgi:asparagine synthase (glutamine-hydrolysing)